MWAQDDLSKGISVQKEWLVYMHTVCMLKWADSQDIYTVSSSIEESTSALTAYVFLK